MTRPIDYKPIPYGFAWGPLDVIRTAELPGGRVVVSLITDRGQLDVYATASGQVRVYEAGPARKVGTDGDGQPILHHGESRGEWSPPAEGRTMGRRR